MWEGLVKGNLSFLSLLNKAQLSQVLKAYSEAVCSIFIELL